MSAAFEPHTIAEKIELTRATLCSLRLLVTTLAREEEFIAHLRQSAQSQTMVVGSLTELLQGINPRTEREDHLVNVARCVITREAMCVCVCERGEREMEGERER